MTNKLFIGIRGFGIGKLLEWDAKCTGTGIGGIVTISDVMNAVKILMPLLLPQVLIDFRVAILNYQHHPVTTMDECITISSHAAQRPFEPVHSDDMEFLQESSYRNITRFFSITCGVLHTTIIHRCITTAVASNMRGPVVGNIDWLKSAPNLLANGCHLD